MISTLSTLTRPLALTCLIGLLLVAPAQAQTYPHPISLQGLLLDAEGNPISGNYDLTFAIYDAPEGGTLLWTETHTNLLVNEGLYNVALGLDPNLPPDLFVGLLRYLEVSIDGEVQRPRITLQAVPLAYAAKTLSDGALQAGQNVSITRQAGGALRIDASGGGGGGGLSSVATDATLVGEGTTGSPLGLADDAVQAGSNVTVTRTSGGAFVVSSTGGGGGLTSVASDATLTGNGTTGSPLGLANGAVTGAKIANGALVAGQNVTITRQNDGDLEIASTGSGGGLTSVTSDATLVGDGTAGSPLGLADDAVSEAKLADDAVTGPKMADGTLVAGQNVTLSRQGDGSIEIASSGLSLPYSGSANTSSGALEIENTGSGDGIHISSAGDDGVEVSSANYGFYVAQASSTGFLANYAAQNGMYIARADQVGLRVESSGGHGLLINQAGTNGLQVNQAGTNGLQIGTTTFDGIQIQAAGRDGIRVSGAGGLAGQFQGDVNVSGTLSKGGGAFKIDHPLDPANKYLQHSFVESPDMMNVYNGNVVLDAAGEAVVVLPDYFETLNRDFRYQLTCIGGFAPVYIAEKISGNRFRIAGGAPGLEVSWQVTGIRHDAWANAHRIVVEQDKPADERGYYLHPRLYGQPETRGVIRSDTPATSQQSPVIGKDNASNDR